MSENARAGGAYSIGTAGQPWAWPVMAPFPGCPLPPAAREGRGGQRGVLRVLPGHFSHLGLHFPKACLQLQ